MSKILTIAAKDLKLRFRDRSVLIIAFLAPLVLALIFNFVFGSAFGTGSAFEPELGIVANDSPRTSAILEDIATEVGGTWQTFPDRGAAELALDDGNVAAVFVVPAGFDAEVDQGQGGSLEVIGDVDSSTSTQIATAIAESYGLGLDQIGLNVATAIRSGGDPATVIPAATSGGVQPLADLTEITAGVRQLDGTTSTVAGMAVFFLLFTAQVGLLSLLEERRDGTLARILSTPTRPSAVLAAKSLVSVVLGLASLAVLIVAGRFILGAEWGNPAGVLVLVVAAVLAAVGISALTTGLAKTPEAAGNMQGIVGTVLGLLGGVFFPIGDDGGILASISALTPHHWFIRGLSDLAGGQSASAALPSVWPLLTIAAVTAFVASFLIRRQVSK
ncbi:MAG TPA: ABC transporter permease [Acidimicrobiia bacterium]|nr:ABC transporter permease [Acidimicrobiia bacterium]